MNGMKPTIGIEFDNEYINAKNKLIDFAEALTKLTNTQSFKDLSGAKDQQKWSTAQYTVVHPSYAR